VVLPSIIIDEKPIEVRLSPLFLLSAESLVIVYIHKVSCIGLGERRAFSSGGSAFCDSNRGSLSMRHALIAARAAAGFDTVIGISCTAYLLIVDVSTGHEAATPSLGIPPQYPIGRDHRRAGLKSVRNRLLARQIERSKPRNRPATTFSR
jgi:hypothetical protein